MTSRRTPATCTRSSATCSATSAAGRPGKLSVAPRFFEVSPVPTLALYGPDDHVLWRHFPQMCEVAFSELVGPFIVQGAGRFLQWERAELLNRTVEYFLADLR